ncbi:hypothetical protein [Halomonas kalidii]|uniref:Uncharacterized protein n=1 Tax=Halomonas kalidii TaxID=3043293 RepID=A0ABT6VP85_9GAMM|nr:hypothetical protein [Halomonas kalidii]MDI5935806.1 hypothetical protein [Halomonas kalidii]
MGRSITPLTDQLAQAGMPVTEGDGEPTLEMPWFVRTLPAFSGWLAAVFLMGFIALGAAFVIESSVTRRGPPRPTDLRAPSGARSP